MPNVTLYIRDADIEKWRALENKSAAISALLNSGVLEDRNDGFMTVEVSDTAKYPQKWELRTKQTVFDEIRAIELEVDNADLTNQDPDYWAQINAKKARIQELWAEWREL